MASIRLFHPTSPVSRRPPNKRLKLPGALVEELRCLAGGLHRSFRVLAPAAIAPAA